MAARERNAGVSPLTAGRSVLGEGQSHTESAVFRPTMTKTSRAEKHTDEAQSDNEQTEQREQWEPTDSWLHGYESTRGCMVFDSDGHAYFVEASRARLYDRENSEEDSR